MREAQIIREAEREFNRIDADKKRLTEMADKLRADLSTALITTLEQLKTEDEGNEDAYGKSRAAGGPTNGATGRERSRSRPPKGGSEGVVKRLIPTKKRRAAPGAEADPDPSDSLQNPDVNAS